MAWIAGVDGCPGGWIVVYADTELKNLECCVKKDFKDVMAHHEFAAVAVDMPIGLWEKGKRDCDEAAQEILGKRRFSIFPAPSVSLFSQMSGELGERRAHKRASELNRRFTDKGLSIQSWSLAPKIADVRRFLSTQSDKIGVVHEAHPEVSFAALKSGKARSFDPMRYPKKTLGGLAERRELLRGVFGPRLEDLEARATEENAVAGVAPDDFYDALACLWTARRICAGEARGLPGCDPVGSVSLPMRIVY